MKNKNLTETQQSVTTGEQTRRDFIKKFGKLAAVTPVALTALISPTTSAAINSAFCAEKPWHKQCGGTGQKPKGFG